MEHVAGTSEVLLPDWEVEVETKDEAPLDPEIAVAM